MDERISSEARKHIDTFYSDNPFLALLGVSVTSFEYGRVRLDMDIRHDLTNVYGISHGGVLTTLSDTAMGGACLSLNKSVVTLGMNLSFLKAVPEGEHVYAVGEVIHDGRQTMVCEGRVYSRDGVLCLRSDATFFVLKEFFMR